MNGSCYFGVFINGYSDDWVFDQDEKGNITRVGKYGTNKYNMCGISFFKAKDALIIRNKIDELYSHPGIYETLYWDDAVNMCLKEFNLKVHPVKREQIIELDSVKELEEFDKDYIKYN